MHVNSRSWGERDTLIASSDEEIEQLYFPIVFNGFMFLLFRAKSVTILFPKVKGTIYHIVFVTFSVPSIKWN